MKYFNSKRTASGCFLAFLIAFCGRGTPVVTAEMASMSGAWKIVKVIRNTDDITTGNDFGQSLMMLHANGTYSIGKTALFVVNKNGRWLATPQSGGYNIVLKPQEGGATLPYKMRYDSSGGGKHITVNFITAGNNTYHYVLEKVNL